MWKQQLGIYLTGLEKQEREDPSAESTAFCRSSSHALIISPGNAWGWSEVDCCGQYYPPPLGEWEAVPRSRCAFPEVGSHTCLLSLLSQYHALGARRYYF